MSEEVRSTVPKPFIFVLMPFDEKFSDIYKFGIKGAAEDVNAYAERIDEQIFTSGILERIFNQISKADVIVADMTGRNPNVFYEVGYAHALGKIVLLLTQNADDIPFDLQHRQHLVYAGKIETLRKQLVERLIWAIGESKKQERQVNAERFIVSILGEEIPEIGSSTNIPVVRTKDFYDLPVCIRNGSQEITPTITHIYLFASEDSKLLPGKINRSTEWQIFNAFKAADSSPLDAFDGLSKQYRLEATIPPLPPGAVDQFSIDIDLIEKYREADELFRLRIHSSTNFHDFPFRMKVGNSSETEKDQ